MVKGVYGILVYLTYHEVKYQEYDDLSWLSKLYFSFDWTNAFIIQTLIIFVPYHWMKQITEALSSVQGS